MVAKNDKSEDTKAEELKSEDDVETVSTDENILNGRYVF